MSNKPRSIFGPLLLIAAGVIWLLTKSGTISTSNLWALTHIWPYVLIAAGVGLILRSFWKYASILLDIVIIGGAIYSILNAPQLDWDNPSLTTIYFTGDDVYIGSGEPGSGTIVTEIREVNNFTSIEVDYPAQVFVMQGKSPSIEVEADDNILPGLQTLVRNNKLEIFYKVDGDGYIRPTRIVKITVVVEDLKEVDFDSAGELTIDGLEIGELDISISGAGNLKLTDIVTRNLSVNLSGAGSMTASGKTDNFRLTISGFGSFNGEDLQTQIADVNLSGAGSATVWVEEQLDANISGAGSVNYYGSPNINKQVNGVGGVIKLGDK